MSGIAGLFNLDGRPVSTHDVTRVMEALSVQAPDRQGSWHEGPVGLMHVLTCFTPEDAFERQPVVGAGGRFVLVADARLDNRDELCRRLGIRQGEAESLPDSRFLMSAWEEWGKECVSHLLGAFVFAVWDRVERQLFCARDQVGERVLFTHWGQRSFAFGSAPRALFAATGISRRLDATKLADFLVLLHADVAATFYQGIRRLPAAHSFTVTVGGSRLSSYWELDLDRRIRLRSDGEYVEAARELFDEAVRCRLRSAQPVGISLSGGLDSAAVACTAAPLLEGQGRRLPAFTAVPREGFDGSELPGRLNDETPLVEAIRRRQPNLDVTYVRAEGRTPLDELDRVFRVTEAPMRNPVNRVWTEAIREHARQAGVRVLLNGGVGNLTLSWAGGAQLAKLALSGRWQAVARAVRRLAAARESSAWSTLKEEVLIPLLPAEVWSAYRFWRDGRLPPWASYSALHPHLWPEARARFRRFGWEPNRRGAVNGRKLRASLLRLGGSADGPDLWNAWRSAYGIEARDPMSDRRLQEFCLAIPEDQHRSGDRMRLLARSVVGDRLPEQVLWNPRRGFQAADWYERLELVRGRLPSEIDRLQRSDTASRLLDLPRMRNLVSRWPAAGWNDVKTVRHYRELLLRGLVVGRFIEWAEAEARPRLES